MIPGVIHTFGEEGGARNISGVITPEMTKSQTKIIVVLFASIGQIQVQFGCVLLFLSFHLRRPYLLRFTILMWLLHLYGFILAVIGFKQIGTVAPKAPSQFKAYISFALSTGALITQLLYWHMGPSEKDAPIEFDPTEITEHRTDSR